ncbi:para-aminobenzoate synthase [Mollisia scopiformis]|uniref:aminodeoxychorismate synthase n=1 Tax=Mollisia scopiformis TaxID=149040 RepID=A0A194WV88_MOLSC|nr:para-aminobenzoate synthase [Mollisia scopiformis]KUJ11579.1 para-aminobenzoate synthase [Mollisia scopiformis]
MLIPKPLILFIDAYDSFSNNIISLLETTLDVSVRTIKIDNPALATDAGLHEELRHYVAVICGPGPGHPAKEEDVGLIRRIWKLSENELLPVLGICLGFQSLCLEFGAKVRRLKGPQHGIVRRIQHAGENKVEGQQSIFHNVGEIAATLYQSLCVDIGQDSVPNGQWEVQKWKPSTRCPDLQPLAWVEHDLSIANDAGVEDARVLVAVQHVSKPFWALQYHPESICTNPESTKVLEQWFFHATCWNNLHRKRRLSFDGPIQGRTAVRESLLSQHEKTRLEKLDGHMGLTSIVPKIHAVNDLVCHSLVVPIPANVSVVEISEIVQGDRGDRIVFESSNAHEKSVGSADVRGKYSIIGLEIDDCLRYEYTSGENSLRSICRKPGDQYSQILDIDPYGGIWPFLAKHLDRRQVLNVVPAEVGKESPFWGGFMGYTTYELGLQSIGVIPVKTGASNVGRPDLSFAWVTRSMVIDHVKNIIYLQELAPNSDASKSASWQNRIRSLLQNALPPVSNFLLNGTMVHIRNMARLPAKFTQRNPFQSTLRNTSSESVLSITTPEDADYEQKVHKCQESIRSGDSYEICLTDQTLVTLRKSRSISSWDLYKTLRSRQPAPFASYIRLGSATLVSASPERFLKYSAEGKCELRPMKGTVRKSAEVSTLAQATALLDIPKEKAENLMIVDLVRHDLHGVCGSGNVAVPRLMVVEEYKSVFQMISIVQGQIPQAVDPDLKWHMREKEVEEAMRKRYTGLDVLAASLPPGSMTGAPKKRSCEILQEIEGGKDRSLYSGVVGYMDVAGRGDWSVTIRCMFKWDDEDGVEIFETGEKIETETWHIGAGGAVTALSTARGEREEMLTKLSGTLGLFRQ